MDSGLLRFCGDQSHAAFALCQAEAALHFHAVAFILVILILVSGLAFLGPSQHRTEKPDAALFAIAEIISVSVDFIRQNADWAMSLPF